MTTCTHLFKWILLLLTVTSFSAAAMKCDVDVDGDIDRADISEIFQARGQMASSIDDPRDADNNLSINLLDGRLCQRLCTLAGCAEPPPPAPAPEFSLQLDIRDVDTSVLSMPSDVNLAFSGPTLFDDRGQAVTTQVLTGPLKQTTLTFHGPSEQLRDIKVTAKADGYIDTGVSVLLSEDTDTYRVTLNMVKAQSGQAAPGIWVAIQDISPSVDGGVVGEAIIAETRPQVGTPKVKVSIPAGTQMMDVEGNLVDGAALNIVSFDPYKAAALAAYPGGLNVIAEAEGFLIDGVPQTGQTRINFKSAGFVAITIADENGHKVKQFSEQIAVAMQFQIGTRDADGNLVKVGDTVPVWSYDEDTGKWTYEKEGRVQDLDINDGMFDLVYTIDHLTFFNLDWHYSANCTSARFSLTDLNGAPLEPEQLQNLSLFLTIDSAPQIGRFLFLGSPEDNIVQFANAPRGFPGTLTVFDQDRVVELGSVAFTNVCEDAGASYTLNVDIESSLTYEKAMALINHLLAATQVEKQGGIGSVDTRIRRLLELAAALLANGDERGQDVLEGTTEVIFAYAEAFMDNVDNYFNAQLFSPFGFIERQGVFSPFGGYGCVRENIRDYVGELLKNYATYESFGGPGTYSIGGMALQFFEQAAREYLAYAPTQLAYTARGVSGFVSCGWDIFSALQSFGYDDDESLDSDITLHFEPVVIANIRSMRQDVDEELNFGGGGDLPATGRISFSTAATYEFILQDALDVATGLAASGVFSAAGIAEINQGIAYLEALRRDGKVDPTPPL